MKKSKEIKRKGMSGEVEIPEGIKCEIANGIVKLEGQKGAVSRNFSQPGLKISSLDGKIRIETMTAKSSKREKKMIGTFKAHIKNMVKGAREGHVYKLKVCASHFPMNISVSNNELIIKNFLGEKVPRKIKIKEGVNVKVEGNMIIVEGVNKERAGQVAADIEQLTRITDKDLRIFQDGIYIVEKDGKEIK